MTEAEEVAEAAEAEDAEAENEECAYYQPKLEKATDHTNQRQATEPRR